MSESYYLAVVANLSILTNIYFNSSVSTRNQTSFEDGIPSIN